MMQGVHDMMRNVKKSTTIALWLCSITSLSLIVGSFFVPPLGVIDGSVLRAVGEIMGIIALFILREAIHEGIDAKFTHGNTTIELTNDNDNDKKE